MSESLPTSELKGKRAALLGYGIESRALLPYLQKAGAIVTICDKNPDLVLDEPVATRLGPDYLEQLTDFDIVFRSPGLPTLTRQLQEARNAGVVISSQTQLFLSLAPASIIGVTGTKGKSTTSALIASMLQTAKQRGLIQGEVYLAGNIGTPPITILEQLKPEDRVVLELSSFQLQDVTVSPHIAVVLNVTIDHLDYHKDEAEYISAKKNIVRYQKPNDFLVVNLDSVTSIHFADETPAAVYFYSRNHTVDQGTYVDQLPGDQRLVWRSNDAKEEEICKVTDIGLVGPYNQENVAAAAAAAKLAGADAECIREAVRHFTGLSHRLQFVAEKRGIRYYDDSKSTTPDSTIAAVQAFEQPVTLIVGGSSKGADYSELLDAIAVSKVKRLICIGQEGERLTELALNAGLPQDCYPGGSTMVEIVANATQVSQSGDVVLLSPSAASFDMFKSAEDRGDQFKQAVLALAD